MPAAPGLLLPNVSLAVWQLWVAFFCICLISFLSLYKCPTHTKFWHREFDYLTTHCMKKYLIFFVLSLFHLISWQKIKDLFVLYSPSPCDSDPLYRRLPWPFPFTPLVFLTNKWERSLLSNTDHSSHQNPVVYLWDTVRQISLWLRRGWYILKVWHRTVPCRDTT